MKSTIVNLGSTRGLRLPDEILDAAGVTHAVNVELRGDEVVLTAADEHVEAEGIDGVGSADEDSVLSRIGETDFDHEEWEWPNDFDGLRRPVVSKPVS
ncbi:hypothetical protein GCM10007036_09060 [Alsobacter metallidurans]|uniref:SpoVT-AbrB domain-containing protein n=1 Tax=Alsobacter metallidurans TaxID=340221 RepID=A0A917MGP5_9HYPH|nr:hypothetical protein [Alsobacter metallidurans]GGH11762.1 hypothetical protein GCM10007036_09060 [Alsobacter metallidurans]